MTTTFGIADIRGNTVSLRTATVLTCHACAWHLHALRVAQLSRGCRAESYVRSGLHTLFGEHASSVRRVGVTSTMQAALSHPQHANPRGEFDVPEQATTPQMLWNVSFEALCVSCRRQGFSDSSTTATILRIQPPRRTIYCRSSQNGNRRPLRETCELILHIPTAPQQLLITSGRLDDLIVSGLRLLR